MLSCFIAPVVIMHTLHLVYSSEFYVKVLKMIIYFSEIFVDNDSYWKFVFNYRECVAIVEEGVPLPQAVPNYVTGSFLCSANFSSHWSVVAQQSGFTLSDPQRWGTHCLYLSRWRVHHTCPSWVTSASSLCHWIKGAPFSS